MITIVDYDIGNIAAVANMLKRLGLECQISKKPLEIQNSQRIILPGNGAFDACMRNLRASGLVSVLEDLVIGDKIPILGICVGAQMMGIGSAEGREPGLGWIDMHVERFPSIPNLRIPHMGWNKVENTQKGHLLTKDLGSDSRFYFVHSYYMVPKRPSDVLMKSSYGIDFAAAVCREHIAGVQFHPEKSHRYGKNLLVAFAKI
jgi:glutamine amidotransferase